jgi:threonine/homoserine/homoserine lactone efflux protein
LLEIKLFFLAFFAALVGVIPPGLVNMSVAKTCVRKSKWDGTVMSFGASVIVFFQALVAILMAKYIFDHPYVHKILLRTGLVILALMMVYFFIMANRQKERIKIEKKTGRKSFLRGMGIAALNVFPIPFFVVISSVFNAKGQLEYSGLSILFFSLGAALGTLTTLYLYVISFVKIQKRTKTFAKYSNYFMGFLMMLLVIITLFRIYVF